MYWRYLANSWIPGTFGTKYQALKRPMCHHPVNWLRVKLGAASSRSELMPPGVSSCGGEAEFVKHTHAWNLKHPYIWLGCSNSLTWKIAESPIPSTYFTKSFQWHHPEKKKVVSATTIRIHLSLLAYWHYYSCLVVWYRVTNGYSKKNVKSPTNNVHRYSGINDKIRLTMSENDRNARDCCHGPSKVRRIQTGFKGGRMPFNLYNRELHKGHVK